MAPTFRFCFITSKLNRLVKLSCGLSLLAFVVFSVINLLSSSLYPSFYLQANRGIAFLIAHITYILGILLSPIILSYWGCKLTLIIGAGGLSTTLAALIWPVPATVYAASILIGIAVAFVITGGYALLAKFMTAANVSRNAAIIFTVMEISQLLSNSVVYFSAGVAKTRIFMYYAAGSLLLIAIIGTIFISMTASDENKDDNVSGCQQIYNEWANITAVAKRSDLLLFIPMFFYTGIQLALLQRNYGTWPTFTLEVMKYGIDFGTICALTITTSEVICGIMLILMGIEIEPFGRAFIATMGFIFQGVSCFFLIGLTPKEGSFTAALISEEMSNSTITLIILMAVLLGFGVALIMTQIYAKLIEMYSMSPTLAVTIFKTFQAIAVFIALYYSTVISLPYQCTVCMLIGLFSLFCFIFMERAATEDCAEVLSSSPHGSPLVLGHEECETA